MQAIENYLDKLDENLLIFGANEFLKQLHENHYETVLGLVKDKVHISTYYYWMSGKSPIPIGFLKLFNQIDKSALDFCYEKMSGISAGQKKCSLPKIMDQELAYFIGVVNGDGHIHRNGKFITITVDSEEYVRNTLIPLVKSLFEIEGHMWNFGTYFRLDVGSKAVHSFLSLFCPVGKKTGRLKVPLKIKQDKTLLPYYLAGLFDTDGCIGYTKDNKQVYFVFLQADKEFVYEIYECLKSIDVPVNEPKIFYSPNHPGDEKRDKQEWRIIIGSKKTLNEFLSKINFLHPKKRLKSEYLKEKILNGSARI